VDADPESIRDLAYSVIRVLNRDGEAVGPWAGLLSDEELLEGLRHMMLLRTFDGRMLMAQRQGKTSFYMQHTARRRSAAPSARRSAGDMNFPDLSSGGLLIAGGYPLVDMMCQIYSNERDPLRGRQLRFSIPPGEYGFFSISGEPDHPIHPGRRLGDGVGDQEGHQDRGRLGRRGLDRRGRLSRRSRLRLHLQGAGRPQHRQQPVGDLHLPGRRPRRLRHFAARGLGFGIASLRVDGNDYLAVHAVAKWATERARRNLGPTLIEHVTYRAGAHSTSDDPSAYRPEGGVRRLAAGDPIIRLKNHLIVRGVWSEERHKQAEAEISTASSPRRRRLSATERSTPAASRP
jgi:2-oxoisovalerate dehydrogenase E1 component alpha subunit